jgi:hypothetical protein
MFSSLHKNYFIAKNKLNNYLLPGGSMRNILKFINQNKPKLREFDPTTIQRIKEGAYLIKIISETEVAARKCHFYAGNATDQEIADFFNKEAQLLTNAKYKLQEYYESMTKE